MSRETYKFATAITDAAETTIHGRAIYVGGGGSIGVKLIDGTSVKFVGCLIGTTLNVAHQLIYDSSESGLETSATKLVSLS